MASFRIDPGLTMVRRNPSPAVNAVAAVREGLSTTIARSRLLSFVVNSMTPRARSIFGFERSSPEAPFVC